jgi:ParB family chromosome partitioning protein
LRESIGRFDVLQNLVVRPLGEGVHEVLSGNQRLKVFRELGFTHAPCVIVDLDDVQARLVAQALNRIQGEDDLGLKAELMRKVLSKVPQGEVLSLLPETAENLQALASMGQQDLAQGLQAWQNAQLAKLNHLVFQLTEAQLKVVKEALARVMPLAKEEQGDSPNVRSTALYLLCKIYLNQEDNEYRP